MADIITLCQETSPSLDFYWCSVILFAHNFASHKFALAKSLLVIAPISGGWVMLDAPAEPFSTHPYKEISIPAHFSPAIDRYGLIARLFRVCHPLP